MLTKLLSNLWILKKSKYGFQLVYLNASWDKGPAKQSKIHTLIFLLLQDRMKLSNGLEEEALTFYYRNIGSVAFSQMIWKYSFSHTGNMHKGLEGSDFYRMGLK